MCEFRVLDERARPGSRLRGHQAHLVNSLFDAQPCVGDLARVRREDWHIAVACGIIRQIQAPDLGSSHFTGGDIPVKKHGHQPAVGSDRWIRTLHARRWRPQQSHARCASQTLLIPCQDKAALVPGPCQRALALK